MHAITPLPREQYQGYLIPFDYDTNAYYDAEIEHTGAGFSIRFTRKPFAQTIRKRFTDALYEAHWEAPEAFGVLEDGKPVGVLEVSPESWNNRLRVLNLWVAWDFRGRGIGKALMDHAKEIAAAQKRRAIILETQSCNDPAVGFYLAQGFRLVGCDALCYQNDDIERREVRLEFGYRMP